MAGVDGLKIFDAPAASVHPTADDPHHVVVDGLLLALSEVDPVVVSDGRAPLYQVGEIFTNNGAVLYGPGARTGAGIANEADLGSLVILPGPEHATFSASVDAALITVAPGGELPVRFAVDSATGRPVLHWIQLTA